MNVRRASLALLALLGACGRPPSHDATEQARQALAARDHRTVEIRAIAEHRGVVCGAYGYPLEQAPQLSRRPFALVDGRLVDGTTPDIAACRAKLPLGRGQ